MFGPLPTPAEMAAWDRAAVELGIPETILMENAARAAAACLREYFYDVKGRRVLLFMGSGNNGGDAAALGRSLHDSGAVVLVVHTRRLEDYDGAAGEHARMAVACGVSFVPAEQWLNEPCPHEWARPDAVVDGLLGTGFSGQLRDQAKELVERMNAFREVAWIMSLDIPSGLDGLHGKPCPVAVRAHLTVTFAAAKPGLVLPDAAPFVGELRICEIGMPAVVIKQQPHSFWHVDADILRVIPQPDSQMHKGTAGHVIVMGGSPGLTGAPHLAAIGAIRTGAGRVSVAAPETLLDEIKARCPDIMALSLGEEWSAQEIRKRLKTLFEAADVLVCGPGLGRGSYAGEVMEAVLSASGRPAAVIDADALVAISENPSLLKLLHPDDILTPHPGEAARLLGLKEGPAAVQADRFGALEALKALSPSIWVLKGAGTLMGASGKVNGICSLAVPNLAIAGSGDVLSGCIAALSAQGMTSYFSAGTGVVLHALAGQQLAHRFPCRGNTASDIADAIPFVPRPGA